MNYSLNEIGMQWPATQACFIYEYSLNTLIWGKYLFDKKKKVGQRSQVKKQLGPVLAVSRVSFQMAFH